MDVLFHTVTYTTSTTIFCLVYFALVNLYFFKLNMLTKVGKNVKLEHADKCKSCKGHEKRACGTAITLTLYKTTSRFLRLFT